MQTSQVHCLPIAFDDFKRGQTIGQCVASLQMLSATMDKVFDRILLRVNEEAVRLQDIDERISTAKMKVEKITGVTTATTVHCAAKYPIGERLEGFKTLDHDLNFVETPDYALTDSRCLPSDRTVSRKRERHLIDLLAKVNPDLSSFETGLKRGLGQLPSYLPSVNSMLLFDSNMTPYRDYNVLPSLMGRDAKERGDQSRGRDMDEAPDTFMNPDEALRAQQLDFLHRPAAPDFQPMEFPDLKDFDPAFKNVASNINYASLNESLPSIAPTAHQKSGLPDLPALMDMPGATTSAVPETSSTSLPTPPPLEQPKVTTAPPPPPPPPPPTTTKTTTAPPPPQPSSAARAKVDPQPKTETPAPMAGGLLGDIAKGLKLKSAKKRKLKKKKKPSKPSLADALRARLNQRANFMSGRNRKSKKKKKSKKPALKIPSADGDDKRKSTMNFKSIPQHRERSHTFEEDDEDWSD